MLKVIDGQSESNYRYAALGDLRADSPFEKHHEPGIIHIVLENRATDLDFRMDKWEVLILRVYENGKTFVLRKNRSVSWLIRYMDVEMKIVGPEQTPRV